MITTLHIKNIGIIHDLSIDFNQGFNVLTGETGAGKTLIIDSLNIIAGGRFSKDMIRRGENHSFIECSIYVPDNENSIEGNIIVSREIYSNGRNSCKINGRLVTVNELKEFMKNLIDIHGQHDNQTLLDVNSHISYLDKYIGSNILELKNKYRELFNRYNELKQQLKANYGDDTEKQRKLDLLKYQLNEIEMADLKRDEEEELENRRKLMMNSEKVMESLQIADVNLSENAIDGINSSIRALEKIENIDEIYGEKLNALKNIYYDIQELSRDISSMSGDLSFDEEERNSVEERLDLINSLKRKYGNTIEIILEYKEKVEKDIFEIENIDEINDKLRAEIQLLEKQMRDLSEKMSELRKKYGQDISKKINKDLIDLEMKNAQFNVEVKTDNKFNKNGLDNVEFMISTNVGEDFKPLIKIASGGEMSRIMLAIKHVLADVDEVPIMIFDEIDTGISGIAAKAVGEKIKEITNKHQVLCVTHLASIAAKGDYNYYISKESNEVETKTSIRLLDEESTIREIARIASGDITDIAIEHAKQLRMVV